MNSNADIFMICLSFLSFFWIMVDVPQNRLNNINIDINNDMYMTNHIVYCPKGHCEEDLGKYDIRSNYFSR